MKKKKYHCRKCGAKRIWMHNWAVRYGYCSGKFMADFQRGKSLEKIIEFYYPKKQLKIDL